MKLSSDNSFKAPNNFQNMEYFDMTLLPDTEYPGIFMINNFEKYFLRVCEIFHFTPMTFI